MRKATLLKIAVIVIINLILIFFLIEMYFRFIYDATDQFNFIKTSRQWTERHVVINSMGMRDKEYDAIDLGKIDKDKFIRIGFVGDSFTYGQGIKNPADRFSDLACAALQKKAANIRCYTIALPGASTKDELDLISNNAKLLPPFDIVVVQFFANDIEGYAPFRDILISDTQLGKFLRLMRSYPSHPIFKFALKHSYAIEFFYFQYLKRPTPDRPSYIEITKQNYADPEKWKALTDQFARLEVYSGSKRIPVGVLLFPALDDIREPHQLSFAYEKVGAYLTTHHIPFEDLYSTFKGNDPSGLIINSYDPHPNEKAHQMAAQTAEKLVIQLLQAKAQEASASATIKSSMYKRSE